MSESFLTRWSHRKLQAAKQRTQETEDERAPPAPKPPVAAQGDEQATAAPAAEERNIAGQQRAVDPATLPPIESLGPDSDFRAFLQAGVPAELARAALRRAWTNDPKIRDYIGPAENAWDFTAADGVPGFAPLASEEGGRLMAHLSGKIKSAAQNSVEQVVANSPGKRVQTPSSRTDLPSPNETLAATTENQPSNEIVMQRKDAKSQQSQQLRGIAGNLQIRRHGRALPQ